MYTKSQLHSGGGGGGCQQPDYPGYRELLSSRLRGKDIEELPSRSSGSIGDFFGDIKFYSDFVPVVTEVSQQA